MRVLLVVYDNDSIIHAFPTGAAYVATALKRAGHEVSIYQQDVHHWSDAHLSAHLEREPYDVVGIGVIAGYYQYRKLLCLSEAINASRGRPPHFILGGHGPSPDPVFFLKKTGADAAVIGEGEETIVELLKALEERTPLSVVPGIAFREGRRVHINPRRPLIQDLDSIPMPDYAMFPIEYYRLIRYPNTTNADFVMPVLSARGCTFRCNFCYRMDQGYRTRSPVRMLEEIRFLQERWGINYIDFADELLMSSHDRVAEVCDAIAQSGLRFKWFCNGRLNYATPPTLQRMKATGCVFINYGIEAFDDRILKNMDKALTSRQIVAGIEATVAAGISPGCNMLFGNIGENRETLQKAVDFLLKYDDGAQLRTIRPVTPYPGSPLFDLAVEKGLVRDVEDFYEYKHVNSDLLAVNFTELSDDEFHRALMAANLTLIDHYIRRKADSMRAMTENVYLKRDASFRGYRQI